MCAQLTITNTSGSCASTDTTPAPDADATHPAALLAVDDDQHLHVQALAHGQVLVRQITVRDDLHQRQRRRLGGACASSGTTTDGGRSFLLMTTQYVYVPDDMKVDTIARLRYLEQPLQSRMQDQPSSRTPSVLWAA